MDPYVTCLESVQGEMHTETGTLGRWPREDGGRGQSHATKEGRQLQPLEAGDPPPDPSRGVWPADAPPQTAWPGLRGTGCH